MFEINNVVKQLDINEDCKTLLANCISAEIFNIIRLYNPEVKISKYTKPDDSRVWCEVLLTLEGKDISLFQCRPFIDKGVTLTATGGTIFMNKTYYLYTTQD
jgi:hypothetical protein